MSKFKVVVTDFEFGELNFEEDVFSELDIELVKGSARTEEEVIAIAKDADAILNQYAPISSNVIKELQKCKVVSRYGVGFNTVNLKAATDKGICVCNVPDYAMDDVSDHALALILALTRKIVTLNDSIKNGLWDYKEAVPIQKAKHQVVSIIGFGRIGRRLHDKLLAIGYTVNVNDPYVSDEEIIEAKGNPVSLEEAMKTGDIVSINCPLNEETEGLIGERELKLMKSTAYVVNTARGPIIDEKALIHALTNKQIAGAGLDVVEVEPIPDEHPFLNMNNVILTPHSAWYSEQASEEMRRKAARNIIEVLKGFFPTYLVNPEVKEKIALKEM